MTLSWILDKTFIVEYPMSKEFPISFLTSRLVVLSELFVGWFDTRMLNPWFGKFSEFERSNESISLLSKNFSSSDRFINLGMDSWIERGFGESTGFIWIDLDGSLESSESLWEDSSIWVVWDRSMNRSTSFDLVWTRSTGSGVKTWVFILIFIIYYTFINI